MDNHAKNPAEYVCPEIWEIIFSNPSLSGSDIQKCSQVCIIFRNILHPTRSTWLFPEIFPFVFRYLNAKSVLTCRASCKTWKLAVDKLLENEHDYLSAHNETGYLLPVPFYSYPFERDECNELCGTREWNSTLLQSTLHFHSSTKMSQFLEEFSSHPGNPFPGRTLRVTDVELGPNEQYEQIWEVDLIQVLCHFGDQIHTLHLAIDQDRSAHKDANWIHIIFECLRLTPNLRRLRVEGVSLMDGREYESLPEKNLTAAPKLPHLKSLEFARHNDPVAGWELSGPSFPLQHAILIPYTSNIKRLEMTLVDMPYQNCGTRAPIILPILYEISLKVKSSAQFTSFFSPDCAYHGLSRVTIEIVEGKHKIGDYLRILQRFKKSLKVLRFIVYPLNHWQMARVSKNDLVMLMELSHLEYLQIEGFKFSSVEIVNSLPSKLKYLLLDYKGEFCHRDSTDFQDNWIDLLGPGISADLQDEQAIYASDLWRQLPRLRWLRVTYSQVPIRMYVYRRENWESWLQGRGKWQDGIWALGVFRVKTRVRDFVHGVIRKCSGVVMCCCFCCVFGCCSDDNELELV